MIHTVYIFLFFIREFSQLIRYKNLLKTNLQFYLGFLMVTLGFLLVFGNLFRCTLTNQSIFYVFLKIAIAIKNNKKKCSLLR